LEAHHFAGCASQISQPAIGSIPLEAQLAKLHNIEPHVLVGTPQRIADIARLSPSIIRDKLRRRVDCVILDEADMVLGQEVRWGRYTTMTGAEVVDRLFRSNVEEVPAQLVAISATIDGVTAQRLNRWMRNDKAVRLTTSFVEHTIPSTLTFYFLVVRPPSPSVSSASEMQRVLLLSLRLILRQHKQPRILLFSDENPLALAQCIQSMDLRSFEPDHPALRAKHGSEPVLVAASLHTTPDEQNPNKIVRAKELVARRREIFARDDSSIAKLNGGELLIGVGHYDVSRGLHVSGITHVILFGGGPSAAQFVHCSGRTGRLGSEGDVLCIFPPRASKQYQAVCTSLEIPFQPCKVADLEQVVEGSMGTWMALDDLREHGAPATDPSRGKEDTLEGFVAQQKEVRQHQHIADSFARMELLDSIVANSGPHAAALVGKDELWRTAR
jgi:superfamily II DNA/RNA helicase